MQRIPSAKTVDSRAAAAEIRNRTRRTPRALAELAVYLAVLRLRTRAPTIIAQRRSKPAQALYPLRKRFPRRPPQRRQIPYNLPPKRQQARSSKPHLPGSASGKTRPAKQPFRPAQGVRRGTLQRQRTMWKPRREKLRPGRRIIRQESRSPSWAAQLRRMRSRNRPYIPSRKPIRAAARRCRITAGMFCPVRQEKRQAKIRRAVPISQLAAQESLITAAMRKDKLCRANPRSSAAPLCRLRRQNIRLHLFLRDPLWQEVRPRRIPAYSQHLHQTVRQERERFLTRRRAAALPQAAIPQEPVRSRRNRKSRRTRQRPVRQERSARPSADAIPSLCSRRRAFPRMETPRSHSRTMCPRSRPAARCSRPAESVWMAAPQIGSIPHPQRRYLRQRRLPIAKLVRPHARPRGLMRHVKRSSTLRSAQFPRKAAAQKTHRKLLRIRLPLLPNGRAGNRPPQFPQAA